MKVIDLRAQEAGQWRNLLSRRYTPDPELISQVSTILSEVRQRGDQALIEFARKFDRADFTPQELTVSKDEVQAATGLVKPALFQALEAARANVR